MSDSLNFLKLKRLCIDSYKDPVIYINASSLVCQSEGFESRTRVKVSLNGKHLIATINMVDSQLLRHDQASLSEYAWNKLEAKEGDVCEVTHPNPLNSLRFIRKKIYGKVLEKNQLDEIIQDTINGSLSDVHLAAFVTACAGYRMTENEIYDLCQAMIRTGERLDWEHETIVDKHCVGGLPGNRTTLIVVPIVSAFGLIMPKTSSRSITSPAGTADTMEVFTKVDLDTKAMKAVIEKEGGCIAWGGAVNLSPADDILIRIERSLNVDSEGQMVASILSKKRTAGATHVVIDMPIGPTAKIRSQETALIIKTLLENIGQRLGISVLVHLSDGSEPVGRGVGPSLEAFDVLQVLNNDSEAPQDLKEHALDIAGKIIDMANPNSSEKGRKIAESILTSGKAFDKFQSICYAQGGLEEPGKAKYIHIVKSKNAGVIHEINNRSLARIAKLAGAPRVKTAGLYLCEKVGDTVNKDQPLFEIHSESKGELAYAIHAMESLPDIFDVQEK